MFDQIQAQSTDDIDTEAWNITKESWPSLGNS